MTKTLPLEVLEKIVQILLSNQNKINLLRNDLSTQSSNGNNVRVKTNQFINGLEIDIKNILSLLDRIKNDLKNNPNNIQKTYCLNNDTNMFQDILICGSCDCCRCHKCCECSTNNCSDIQQLNISSNNNNKNNISNEYIKERINSDQDENNSDYPNIKTFNDNNFQNYNVPQPSSSISNNHITYPNLNLDNNFTKDNNNNFNNNNNPLKYYNNEPSFNMNNNKGNIINFQIPSFTPRNNINYNKNFLSDYPKPLGYIRKQPFNQFNNLDIEDNNLPMEEKIKNSAIMKSKRFHGSKSFDNLESPFQNRNKAKIIKNNNNNFKNNYNNYNSKNNNIFTNSFKEPKKNDMLNINDINKNNININYSNKKNKRNNANIFDNNINSNNKNSLSQKKKKLEKINDIQRFLNKLYKQPKDINNRFKKIFGDDIEEKLLNGDIGKDNLIEMDNILDKIIKMSIWGEEDTKNKKRGASNSYDKKYKKQNFVYNPVQEKIKLMKSVKDKQAYFREFPRGWYSTKEYFINNGTEINNENVNKYH